MAIYKEAKRPEVRATGDKMYGVAKDWVNTLKAIKQNSQIDPVSNTQMALCESAVQNDLLAYYKKYAYDPKDPKFDPKLGGNPELMNEAEEEMALFYENDRECMCEAMAINGFNPTMTFTPPLHKDILMNCVWQQGIIPRLVTNTPNVQVEREVRLLVDPTTGEKFDMFQEQYKIAKAVKNARPMRRVGCKFPENKTTRFLDVLFGCTADATGVSRNPQGIQEHLDTDAHISGIVADVMVGPGESVEYVDWTAMDAAIAAGDPAAVEAAIKTFTNTGTAAYVKCENAIIPTRLITYPIIGDSDRTGFNHEITIAVADETGTSAVSENVLISGVCRDDLLSVMTNSTAAKGFIYSCRQASSTGTLPSPHGEWVRKTHMERIPEATHLQAQVSPEEMKDVAVLYNVNQITKHMSFFATMLEEYRDSTAKEFLDDSFRKMPWRAQMSHIFDFTPAFQFVDDHLDWAKKAFLPDLDTWVTQMLNIWNDGNVIVNIVGRSDLIRKLTPTQYTWSTPSQVGPFQLDFVKTVQTSDNRTYQFISADKMRDQNNLIVLLTPKNSERFMYRIYDYQTYVSNELRSSENVYLPAITAFDRWGIFEYQPVQARIKCVNVMGRDAAAFKPGMDAVAAQGGLEAFIGNNMGLNDFAVDNADY